MDDVEYLRHTMSGRESIARNPDLCVCAFACPQVYRDGARLRCRKIDEINKDIQERIDDFNRAVAACKRKEEITGKSWVLESFMRNAHNIYFCEEDLFPEHHVPPSCPYRTEFVVFVNPEVESICR